jgi:hypothetical protein
MEVRLLCDHRNDLVVERTRVTNRLRWHLLLESEHGFLENLLVGRAGNSCQKS